MLVDKQSELMSNLLFTVHQHGGDDVTWKPPIAIGPSDLPAGIFCSILASFKFKFQWANVMAIPRECCKWIQLKYFGRNVCRMSGTQNLLIPT